MNSWQIRHDSPTLLSGTLLPAPWLGSEAAAVPVIQGLLLQPESPKALRAPALIKVQLYTREPGKPSFS